MSIVSQPLVAAKTDRQTGPRSNGKRGAGPSRRKATGCIFCRIVDRELESHVVFEDGVSIAFLDSRPVFPGHTLLVPRLHYETLADLPHDLIFPFFTNAQLLATAVTQAMRAEGSFVAINNRVSQGVPHLHLHVVPRRKGDGLRGFFWPRRPYESKEALLEAMEAIRLEVGRLRRSES